MSQPPLRRHNHRHHRRCLLTNPILEEKLSEQFNLHEGFHAVLLKIDKDKKSVEMDFNESPK